VVPPRGGGRIEKKHDGGGAISFCAAARWIDHVQRAAPADIHTMRVDRELQAQLARELLAILDGWSSTQIVERLCIHPARVSELRSGNLARFSIGRLVQLISRLRYDIEVSIRPTPPPTPARRPPSASVARYDRLGQRERLKGQA